MGWFAVSYLGNPPSEASARPIFVNTENVRIDLNMQDNGTVLYQGESIGDVVTFGTNNDTLTYQVYNQDQAQIGTLQVTVSLPSSISNPSDITVRHFGSAEIDTSTQPTITAQQVSFVATNLQPTSTYSIEIVLPKGIVTMGGVVNQTITTLQAIPAHIWIGASMVLPIITLLILLSYISITRKSWGRSNIKEELATPPANAKPAEVGVLVNGRVTARALAATLINLANRGFVHITQTPDGYSFGKRRPVDLSRLEEKSKIEPLTTYETILLDKIFTKEEISSSQSDINFRLGHHIFSKKIAQAYLGIYESTVQNGWLIEDPQSKFRRYRLLAFAVIVVAIIGFALSLAFGPDDNFYYLVGWVGVFLSGILMYQIVPFMPKRTDKGNQDYIEWVKFKNYISSSKKIPTESAVGAQKLYEQYLPYAIVFGREVEWTERFLHLPFAEPEWFTSSKDVDHIEEFANVIFPIISQVAKGLTKSREPYAV